MKKFFKVIGKVLLGFLAVILLFLSGTFIWNKVATNMDHKKGIDYGQKIDVFGNKMNVVTFGEDKTKETIVMLTGYGTIAPALDFQPMINEMKDDYNVVVIEPFGYGMSESSKRPRTKENIAEELHEAVRILGIDEFIVMGHSIAGIYTLNYVNTYPGQVKAFIGIDTSVPEQYSVSLPTGLLNFARESGLLRLFTSFSPKPTTKEEEIKAYVTRNQSLSPSITEEGGMMKESFESLIGTRFPEDLPVYLFVATESEGQTNWFELHENQIDGLPNAKMLVIEGPHYLHHDNAKIIGDETKAFLKEYKL